MARAVGVSASAVYQLFCSFTASGLLYNRTINQELLVRRPNTRGIPETMLCRILMFVTILGPFWVQKPFWDHFGTISFGDHFGTILVFGPLFTTLHWPTSPFRSGGPASSGPKLLGESWARQRGFAGQAGCSTQTSNP